MDRDEAEDFMAAAGGDEPDVPTSKHILQETPRMIDWAYRAGLKGWSNRDCADDRGVHPNTICEFFHRALEARAARERGKAERRQRGLPPVRRAHAPDPPAAGEICPTCGQPAGHHEDTVTFTRAELDDARRAFDDLIDRHLAARRADRPAGNAG